MDKRLRTARLARGMTLETLAKRMGGIVTPMALSKYEHGACKPSPKVMARLLEALRVKEQDVFGESKIIIEFLKYRKRASFSPKEGEQLKGRLAEALEARMQVQTLLKPFESPALPRCYPVHTPEDAELAAADLRHYWHVGQGPIPNLTRLLEMHLIHVFGVEASDTFDGISAVIRDTDTREVKGAAVASRLVACGERWRMNLAHELGHIVLQPVGEIDEERAAFHFASAFLAPAGSLYSLVGRHRTALALEELMELRAHFGISMQAILYRVNKLGIISDRYAKEWWKMFARNGWRKAEPGESAPEEPCWLIRTLRRAVLEGRMTHEDAEAMLGVNQTLALTSPPPPRTEDPAVPATEPEPELAPAL